MRTVVGLFVLGAVGCGGSGGDKVTVTTPFARDASLAFRDGDGDWTVKPASETSTQFDLSSDSYTLVVGCSATPTTGPVVVAYQLLGADTHDIAYDGSCARPDTTPTVHINNSPERSFGFDVFWGPDDIAGQNFDSGTGTYPTQAAHGTRDIVAVNGALAPSALVVQRATTLLGTESIDIDFVADSAIALTYMPSPALGVRGVAASAYVTAGGTEVSLGEVGNAGDPLAVVDPAQVPEGDLQVVTVAGNDFLDGGSLNRSQEAASKTPNLGIVMPEQIEDIPDFEWLTTAGAAQFHGTWAAHPDLAVDVYQIQVGFWQMYVSAGIFEGDPSFLQPDMSSVTGWDQSLALTRENLTPSLAFTAIGTSPRMLEEAIRSVPHAERERSFSGVSFSSIPAPPQ
jgi:hypothetical protein